MKGVILGGGMGTRLSPLTKVCNKHLLPVYNKPMIYYPIEFFVKSGITDILLVCGGNSAGDFLRVLGNGEEFGLKHIHYRYQSEPRGIADALSLAEGWANDEPITVILGDNIFEKPVTEPIQQFEQNPSGAVIFGTEVSNPQHYGVIEKDEAGNITRIVEKPKNPTSNVIATGLYIYDSSVWTFIRQLTPSARGELEITDVNNHYLNKNQLSVVELNGFWCDCGENFESYIEAGIQIREWERNARSQAHFGECKS